MKRIFKIFCKSLLWIFSSLILIILLLYFLIRVDGVQLYITKQISNILSQKINSKVTIKSIKFELFNAIEIEDLYVEDLKKDTLLFVANLSAYLRDFSLENSKININKITIDNLYGSIDYDDKNTPNFQFIIDAFQTKDTLDTNSSNWKINCKKFDIKNSRFNYLKDINGNIEENKLNFNYLKFSKLNLQVSDISYYKDSVFIDLRNVNFEESSGFKLIDLNSRISIYNNRFEFKTLNININNSSLAFNDAKMSFDSFEDFNDFNNNVKLDLNIDSIIMNLSDIGFFTEQFAGFDYNVGISGQIKGKVADLRTKNLKLFFGNESSFSGNIQLQGLPNVDDLFIIADISKLKTNKKDIEQFPLPPYNQKNYIVFPENLRDLTEINYKGNITGFLSDIVAYGELNTNLGTIQTDISIKNNSENDFIVYNGKVKAKDVNLKSLSLNNENLGKINANIKVKASQKKNTQSVTVDLEGKISSVEIKQYLYKDIAITGKIVDKKYDGAISINDNNVNLEFLGRLDFTKKIPEFDFTADVRNINFYKINLIKKDSLSSASFLLAANFKGDNIDNIIGNIRFINLKLKNSLGLKSINNFDLTVNENESKKILKLYSDAIDADISGNYSFYNIIYSVSNVVKNYLPSFIEIKSTNEDIKNINEFDFNIRIKSVSDLLDMYANEINIADNTVLKGNFNSQSTSFRLEVESDSIVYKAEKMNKLKLLTRTVDRAFSIYLETEKVRYSGLDFSNFMLNSDVYNDSIQFNIHWFNDDSVKYSGDIYATAVLNMKENSKTPSVKLAFKPSNIIIADNIWNILPSKVFIDSTFINIKDLEIKSGIQKLLVEGIVSHNKSDSLHINFKNLDLKNINSILRNEDVKFEGILNGEASISDIYNKLIFKSKMEVDSLVFNNDKLGDFFVNSIWNSSTKSITLNAYTHRGNIKTLAVSGDYFTESNTLDFKLTLEKLRLNIFEPFVDGVLKDLRGIASGDVSIKGNPTRPLINGDLTFQKTAFTVEYLKTRYNFSNVVHVRNNHFEINNVTIFDMHGNSAIANGKITHNNFQNFKLNINLDAKNFCFLNTTNVDNSLYYGTAYASGIINVSGSPENININVIAKTEKNTKFFIPLSSSEDVAENNFIKFVTKSDYVDLSSDDEYKVDLSGITMNIDLEATPDAEVQIIFDSKVGDIIKARGSGNISMAINTLGKFKMMGEYVIEQGDYLFTLQNVINKRFDIENGSSIKWNGDAYDAFLDINAIYKLKASLYDLVLDTNENYKKRVPVECILRMTNNIMNPDIKFNINLPSPDDKASNQIASLSDEELNKQILSLLVLNRFYTPDNLRGMNTGEKYSGNAVGANSSELLSNQLSHWLSQISNDFDIGVNYRPGDEISSDELEVALSTQIFNDRVNINGNVGVGGNKTASNSSGLVGDFSVDVKINKSGKLRVKGFTKSNENTLYENSSIQGIGLFYREEFNTLGDLYRRYSYLISKNNK